MRISKLDLFGFKSFPDRTSLQFGRGISCVVGPNGSGKSNVVDALKWVIGEQSARSLRGADMSDVIFAGSTERKPVGFAEVSLTLDVDGGEPFPGEYANLQEIQVGRRLHRSGASEYLINQVKCRRKDVVDLFLDTGIGTNLYSFIEQGRVDKVVSATPHERRGLIDEAAGISRYKARREEARTRLEATVQQLDRAADVADEMGRRLKVLERQVIKASRFRRARARVRQREIFLSLVKYQGLAADRRALQHTLRDARGEEAAARRGLLRREEDLRVRREELQSVEEAARTWRDELAEVDARLRELQSQKTLQGQRAREATEQAEAAAVEQAQAEEELATGRRQLEETIAALRDTDRSLAEEGATARDRDGQRADSLAEVVAAEKSLEGADAAWQALQGEVARLEAEHAAVEERRGAIPSVVVKLEAQQQEVGGDVASAEAEAFAVAARVQELGEAEAQARSDLGAVEAELLALDAERQRIQEAHDRSRREAQHALSTARSRLDAHRETRERLRRDRERAREQAAAEARRQRDRQVGEARRRADQWVDAVEREARRREMSARKALEAETARWRQLEAEGQQQAQRDAEGVATQRLKAAEQQVRQALAPLEQGVRKARDRVARVREEVEATRVALAEAEAVAAGLRARLKATERPAALAKAVPLVDRLPPAEAVHALAAWGRRATLPALDEPAAVATALSALKEGQAAELWWWRRQSPPVVDDAADVVAALELHGATGRAVRFPGGRVEADGTVSVGLHDVAAERVEARRRLEVTEAAAAEHAAALDVGRIALDAAEHAVEEAEETLASGRRDGDRALAAARAATLDHTRAYVQEQMEALYLERDRALEALSETVDRHRRHGEVAAEGVRAHREDALAIVLAAVDVALEGALASLPSLGAIEDPEEEPLKEAVASAQQEAEVRSVAPTLPDRQPVVVRVAQARELHQRRVQERLGAESEAQRVRQRQDELARRQAEIAERLGEVRTEAAHWAQRLGEVLEARDTAYAALHQAVEAREAAVVAHRAEQERHQALVVSTESADAARRALLERKEAQVSRRDELLLRNAALEARVAAVGERREQAAERAREATTAASAAAEEHEGLGTRRAEVYDRLERERARRTELHEGIKSAEQDLDGLRRRLEDAVRGTQELVDRSAAVRADIEALRERIDDRYQVSIPGLLDRIERAGRVSLDADEDVAQGLTVGATEVEGVEPFVLRRAMLDDEEAVRQAVEELEVERNLLAGLGEVHLGALDEYTELAERHGDLEAQRADLEGSVGQLRAAISKMNRTCRERFREAFDQVNENFQQSYPKLLGGGSARLALTDDEDLLETGVEIFVQPPGKRLQHLQLLSGGEKAMTAIALLIALFRVKPSPFCILDEVDAPLDERNGGRFNTMLRELAETSQFVVITHNRKTMECADTLYGISMTRPGVSTLVTVSLADAPV